MSSGPTGNDGKLLEAARRCDGRTLETIVKEGKVNLNAVDKVTESYFKKYFGFSNFLINLFPICHVIYSSFVSFYIRIIVLLVEYDLQNRLFH